eukprot:4599578-Pyramimonas_sp.AAC.1
MELYQAYQPLFSMLEFYCRPWSQSNNNAEPTELEKRRDAERPLIAWATDVYAPPAVDQNGGHL